MVILVEKGFSVNRSECNKDVVDFSERNIGQQERKIALCVSIQACVKGKWTHHYFSLSI
jgi:hypothetical protein